MCKRSLRMDCRFSIIVPVLNEAESINSQIAHVQRISEGCSCEIIVVDGDPEGATIKAVKDGDIISVASIRGRAWQMNEGARVAGGDVLLFLHADTQLPENALTKIDGVLRNQNYVAGAFDLSLDSGKLILNLIGRMASVRSRMTRVPYGDQAIFVRREYFDKIGRFKEIPLLEDVELMRRIKKRGDRIIILPDPVTTSARRWDKEGIFFVTLRNMLIINLYRLGVSPERLAKYYGYTPETEG
jgi:rSAM/selenodomain-associated transferase 2